MIWKNTRGDLKALLRDIASHPGKTYYATAECTQTGKVYYEITFRNSRLWGPVWGHLSAAGTLAHYGQLTDTRPAGRNIAVDPPKVPQEKRGAKTDKVAAGAR